MPRRSDLQLEFDGDTARAEAAARLAYSKKIAESPVFILGAHYRLIGRTMEQLEELAGDKNIGGFARNAAQHLRCAHNDLRLALDDLKWSRNG